MIQVAHTAGPRIRPDNSIQWINRYSADSVGCFTNTYPVDSNNYLSDGDRYPPFKQPGPGAYPRFCSMKRLRELLLPLDGMLVHRNFIRFPSR